MACPGRAINAFVGTDTGLLKTVCFPSIASNHVSLLDAAKDKEICEIYRTNENELWLGRRNGVVQKVKTGCESELEMDQPFVVKDTVAIRGLCTVNDNLVTCTEDGCLQVRSGTTVIAEKSCGDHISKMKANPCDSNVVCTGGKENDLKLWHLDQLKEPLFRAKNVRNDSLNLRVPVWVTNMDFISPESTTKVVVATGYSNIKLYDIKAQRRPLHSFSFSEHPITAIAVSPDNNYVALGNSAGYMGLLDLRTGKELGRCKGIAGGIRVVAYHAQQPYIVECGLDRFIRVYDSGSRQLLFKMYLKSQLTALSLSESEIVLNSAKTDKKENKTGLKRSGDEWKSDDEDSDVWDEMAVVQDLPKRKKKHQNIVKKS